MASETKGSTLTSATFRRRTTSDRRYRTLLSHLSTKVNKDNARLLFKLFDVPSFTGDIMLGSPDIGSGLFMYIDGQKVISSDDVSYLEKVFMHAKEYAAVRLIREYDNEIHGRPKIQDGIPTKVTELPSLDPYDVLLYNLSRYVNPEITKYLVIQIGLTDKEQEEVLESINPGLEIFKHLERKKMISRKDVSYLVDIFKGLNIEPALNSLERYPRETGQEYGTADTINELPEIQPFTFLLYNLSRCVPKQVIHEIMTRQHIELWITQSKMDNIMHSRNPTIEFIKHLEKRRRITRRDVSLLKTLFKDLLVALVYLNQYETEIQKSKLHEGKFLMSPIGLHTDVEINPYSFLLYNLSRCISKETVEIMIANEAKPSDPKLNIIKSKSPIIEFVKYLEEGQKISRNDVSYLKAILSSSGLNIASQYVKQYQHEIAHSIQGSKLYCMDRFNRDILTEIRRKIGLDRMLTNGLLCLEDVSNATNSTYATRDLNIDNLVTIFFARILSNDLRAFSVFRTFFKIYESQSVVIRFPDLHSNTHTNSGISCRDALYAIFLSSDFNVRLMLILKMAACQFAVPILLPYPGDSSETVMMTFMELYHLNFTWFERGRLKEGSATHYPFPTVAAVKFGESKLSKSSVINTMFGKVQTSVGHDFFLIPNEDNFLSVYSRGMLEAAWYLPVEDTYQSDTTLNQAMCVMNLRGCCNRDSSATQRQFVCKYATVLIAFIENENRQMFLPKIVELSKNTNVIVVVTFPSSERYPSLPTIRTNGRLSILECQGCSELRIAEEVCKLLRQVLQSEAGMKRNTIVEEGISLGNSLKFRTITEMFVQ